MRREIRYAVAHQPVRSLMALVAMASLFGRGPLELLPAFAPAWPLFLYRPAISPVLQARSVP